MQPLTGEIVTLKNVIPQNLETKTTSYVPWVACVAWWFLSNFGALGKRENHDKKRQSREEPGIQTFEKPLCVFAFKLLKPPSYASYTLGNGGFFLS